MNNTVFHNKKFELNGVPIPDFELVSGKIIKVYVPNFDSENNGLGYKFCLHLSERFKNQNSELMWIKEYSETRFRKFLKPISVGDFIIDQLKTDYQTAQNISEYLELDFNEKVKNLILGKGKALAIKCNFEKYNMLIFDYYGIGASEIDYVERIVNSEIRKGKSAIIFDRLEFQRKKELYENIEPIKIKVPNAI
ncbi:hypothetical protein [Aquimarina macrocephali]|uniref:hypothetical protein n=1 Tax=Aquimarina macrocephali TaxID=666563 RepID=UPI0004651AEF|nr:hypothetical protein [Aquimarina macrocephali]